MNATDISELLSFEHAHDKSLCGTAEEERAEVRRHCLELHAINCHDLDRCEEGECFWCAHILCPFGFELHLHHDGCGACCHFGVE